MSRPETATSGLREDHQLILKVSGVLETILDGEPDRGLDFDGIEDCVAFIRLFADACHHGQEEDLLFPELQAKGMPRDSGPIAVMLREHEMGRELVGHMQKALPEARDGDADARNTLVNAGRGYVDLIRAHILKEDNVLFNHADHVVYGEACARLCQGYEEVCRRRFEGRTKDELEALADQLIQRHGPS